MRQDPAQYFGGIVKQLARDHGIDLGLRTSAAGGPAREQDHKAASTVPRPEPETSPDERARVRELLRHLAASFETKVPD